MTDTGPKSAARGKLLRGASACLLLTLSSGLAGPVLSQAAPASTASASAPAVAMFARPPAGSGIPFGTTAINLRAKGYVEEEFFVSGHANRYRIKDPLANAQIIDGNHPYATRILVRRPVSPARFNGRVIVEWYNVTGGQDLEFVFGAMRDHLVDQGYVWIGVSAQRVGVEALRTSNPARYGAMNVTASNDDPAGGQVDDRSDVLSYDIYAQIGAALRKPQNGIDPLGGLKPRMIIAAGESQSALRLSRYYNAIHPLYPRVYDAFFLYDRLLGGFRTDVGTKMFSFGSEVLRDGFGAPPADNANLRLWEVAGAAHLSYDEIVPYMDEQVLRNGIAKTSDGKPANLSQTFIGCNDTPLWSRVPNGQVLAAGLEGLVRWTQGGKPPANGPRLRGDDKGKLYRGADGRVEGGVRLAAYDAPMSRNMGANSGPGYCSLPGSHRDFSVAELCQRYVSQANYASKVVAITRRALRDGFLLPKDADRTIREARGMRFVCPKAS